MKDIIFCPVCNHKLNKRWEGYVCVNYKCPLRFKLGKGWVYLSKEKESSKLFLTSKYDFNVEAYFNRKNWLELKSMVLYKKHMCEICSSDKCLQVHHILSRSKYPELQMDIENLMVLCEDCHKEIHKHDKYAYRVKKNE